MLYTHALYTMNKSNNIHINKHMHYAICILLVV